MRLPLQRALGRVFVSLGWMLHLPSTPIFCVGAVAIFAACFRVFVRLVIKSEVIGRTELLVIVCGFFSILGGFLLRSSGTFFSGLGRRMGARSAEELIDKDLRAPIVYLRSFVSDRTWVEDEWLVGSTFEEHLARALNRIGPFVAIGRPRELLAESGAARIYVEVQGDQQRGNGRVERWQEKVEELLHDCRAVVFAAGETPGLQWELGAVVKMVAPERVLLFLPFDRGKSNPGDRQARYDRFRLWARDELPMGLPDTIGSSFFIYFDEHWNYNLFIPPRTPFLFGFVRIKIKSPCTPIRPLLEELHQDSIFLESKIF